MWNIVTCRGRKTGIGIRRSAFTTLNYIAGSVRDLTEKIRHTRLLK